MLEALLERLARRDRAALARLLTYVARGEGLPEIAHALKTLPPRSARVVALTGSGGVGKSTLLGRLLPAIRLLGLTTAVLACDPQSPLTGGALLGDRFRMGSAVDEGVFIRSVAAVGGRGAVAEHVELMIRLLEAFGFDVIFLETVGAGQGDVAVRALADVTVLLLQPESGDEVQWEKAGIFELADVIAVNKSDLPAAAQTAAQVKAALELTPQRHTAVVLVSGKSGAGILDLWHAIKACPLRRSHPPETDALLRLAQETLAQHWRRAEREHDADQARIVEDWRQGATPADEAARRLLAWAAARAV